MSLFDTLSQWAVIKKITNTWGYRRILEKRNEDRKTDKQIRKEKKAELSDEEYHDWYRKEYYQKKKWELAYRYQQRKAEEEAMLEEIYTDVYDVLEAPKTIDEIYMSKYEKDNLDYEWHYTYSRWASRLACLDKKYCKYITFPVRIVENYKMNYLFAKQLRKQEEAYSYIYPHIWDIRDWDFMMSDKQKVTNYPMWSCINEMLSLVKQTSISKHQLCEVASALMRDVYIQNEVYLWRCSFLFWDCIVTEYGHMFLPSLEHNIGWLNADTIDTIHSDRMAYHSYKKTWTPPIAILWDAYLIRVPSVKVYEEDWTITNYWHYDYYVVPYWHKWGLKKETTYEEFYKNYTLIYCK